MEDFNSLAKKMEDGEKKVLQEKAAWRIKIEKVTPKYLSLTLVISIIFLIFSCFFIVKEFRKRHRYQKELERKINEINMSHAELEQIAFIASHDLQEPLRKMRTFGGRLLLHYKDKLNEEGEMMLNRLDFAARRMQGLIEDLVDYTNLINSEEPIQKVNLNDCLEDVIISLSNLVTNTQASFNIEKLPEIKGYPFQLKLLFTNLVHNAIKFSKENGIPKINISSYKVEANDVPKGKGSLNNDPYLLIKVEDNGIGFANEFAKKIFVMFQRLHTQNSSYEGKGIGLSICKRVMTNHNGFITAEGELGKGATFNLYFPL
jgi:light-regulated signal transduction histidine kinase (bacteriophytochrome)